MTGFNLPPGVEVHHIPGNRPEDSEEDEFFDHIAKMLGESIGEQRADHFFDFIDNNDWDEVLREYVSIASGFATAKVIMQIQAERDYNEANDS